MVPRNQEASHRGHSQGHAADGILETVKMRKLRWLRPPQLLSHPVLSEQGKDTHHLCRTAYSSTSA